MAVWNLLKVESLLQPLHLKPPRKKKRMMMELIFLAQIQRQVFHNQLFLVLSILCLFCLRSAFCSILHILTIVNCFFFLLFFFRMKVKRRLRLEKQDWLLMLKRNLRVSLLCFLFILGTIFIYVWMSNYSCLFLRTCSYCQVKHHSLSFSLGWWNRHEENGRMCTNNPNGRSSLGCL